jgi:hypothetical protein
MTYLGKISESRTHLVSDRVLETELPSARRPDQWLDLMRGWLDRKRGLSAGDLVALTELVKRGEAVNRWRSPKARAE